MIGRAPHLERLGDDPDPAVVADGRRPRVGASDIESDHGRGEAGDPAMIIPTMRIVPVLDLKRGIVVHALRGDRAGYAPLCSPLVDGSEPVAVARALCAHTGSERLYVADLDAIAGAPADVETLRRLAAVAELWVDAGATTAARVAAGAGA